VSEMYYPIDVLLVWGDSSELEEHPLLPELRKHLLFNSCHLYWRKDHQSFIFHIGHIG
jgi:hypothetical protein